MATRLTDEESIEKIIGEMSVAEKAACVTGETSFYTRKMEKYEIPATLWLDGGTGYNTNQKFLDTLYQRYAKKCAEEGHPIDEEQCTARMGGLEIVLNDKETWDNRRKLAKEELTDTKFGCYPPGMFLAATWNPEVIEECGHALGKEANARGVDVLLGTPNVNIHRDPLNGRLFEGYSEDPCLVSKLAPSFVKGVQAEGVLADVKHFAANNQETDRMGINEHIPERALREIYFPGFKACVDAGCKTVMSAYNKINGTPCAQNRWLLKDVLRKEWGFQGCVVSDWSAAYDQAEAAAAGNDLVMPGPRQLKPIIDAVADGSLKEADLDDCVRHVLKAVLQTPTMTGKRLSSYSEEEGIQAAYNAAKEGITLLKNDGVLPLCAGSDVKSDDKNSCHEAGQNDRNDSPCTGIAFFGEKSRHMMDSGAGSAQVNTSLTTNVYDCVADIIGTEHVTYEAVNDDTSAIIATVGVGGQEGADRADMGMDPVDRKALDAAIRAGKEKKIPVIVLLNIAGPVDIADWEPDAAAILSLYIPGMEGGRAAADILFGRVNPSGKLPLTFPKYYRDCPTYGNFPGYNSEVWYGEGIYVGYRYYEKKNLPVMYPFGYGLSYTTFEISNLKVPAEADLESGDLKVSVKIKNTGNCAGSDVIQLYVHDNVSTLDKPYKELKAFRKVSLEAGEEKEVSFTLTRMDFASYDTRLKQWAAEPGEFTLLVGDSSDHTPDQAVVNIRCGNPYGIGPLSDIIKVVSDPKATAIVEKETGVKLREAAGSYIVFQPLTTFEDIWDKCVRPAMNVSDDEAETALQEIYTEWKKIS